MKKTKGLKSTPKKAKKIALPIGKTKLNAKSTKKIKAKGIKAIGLFSGGLDSIVASKLMQNLGFEVYLLNFQFPYPCKRNPPPNGVGVDQASAQLGLPLEKMERGQDYLKILTHANHGYGTGANACVDCRIYGFIKAKEYAKKIGAKIIFTGEVIGERPLSQTRQALELIERKTSLVGKILRPLSGRLLPATEAEQKGWIKRKDLLNIQGRRREKQMQLAKEWSLKYPSPGGGCFLTEKHYGLRLGELIKHKEEVTWEDLAMLQTGRYFVKEIYSIIVGRNKEENIRIRSIAGKEDILLECEEGVMGPITALVGSNTAEAIKLAARLTAYFSDARKEGKKKVNVNIWEGEKCCKLVVSPQFDIGKEIKKGLVWIGQNQQTQKTKQN